MKKNSGQQSAISEGRHSREANSRCVSSGNPDFNLIVTLLCMCIAFFFGMIVGGAIDYRAEQQCYQINKGELPEPRGIAP